MVSIIQKESNALKALSKNAPAVTGVIDLSFSIEDTQALLQNPH